MHTMAKINLSLSSWLELDQEVSKGLVIGLVPFSIYLNNIFFYLHCGTYILSFANVTTTYMFPTKVWNLNLKK